MKSQPDLKKSLIVVFLVFFILLQFPLISIFNQPVGVSHWPLLFVSILLAWVSLILVLFLVIEGNPFKSKAGK